MFEDLQIISWPDPRLKKVSEPVREVTPELRELAVRMLELMRQAKGVGLAAPQVGRNIRLFVMNPTGEPNDNRVYINPQLSDPEGDETSEEGCLSLPNVNVQVNRHRKLRLQAHDLDGNLVDQTDSGYIARIWQHEFDHLNGTLIIDRMGLADKLKHRRVLRELQDAYEQAHPKPRAAGRLSRSKAR